MAEQDSWDDDNGAGTAVVTEKKQKLKKPKRYKVLLHNDDFTTMEFVVMVLRSIFRHTDETAVRVMLHVHQKGVGVAGVYTHEIAESKVQKTTQIAREQEFPLRCTMESEEL
jgi:ATP-dependent Clp protease adaptor protein ClpS